MTLCPWHELHTAGFLRGLYLRYLEEANRQGKSIVISVVCTSNKKSDAWLIPQSIVASYLISIRIN